MELQKIVNRIESLMAHYELSAANFADKIGVQRSSISHLLKGRNKPSLDFLLKVKAAFPDTDINWLLFGQGNLNNNQSYKDAQTLALPASPTKTIVASNTKNKKIDRVVIFYADGTFKSYTQD